MIVELFFFMPEAFRGYSWVVNEEGAEALGATAPLEALAEESIGC